MRTKLNLSAWLILAICSTVVVAQTSQPDAEAKYAADISKRADDIVAKLDLTDNAARSSVHDLLVDQYRSLRDLDAVSDPKANAEKRATLHQEFLKKLSLQLSPEQIEKVKDGLTYNVMNVTYNGYCDMIPTLTEAQKSEIKTYLIEARELAMDGGSSKEKHQIFGKYKGKINLYLSSEGYDLKKETKAWQERLKARRAAASQPTS